MHILFSRYYDFFIISINHLTPLPLLRLLSCSCISWNSENLTSFLWFAFSVLEMSFSLCFGSSFFKWVPWYFSYLVMASCYNTGEVQSLRYHGFWKPSEKVGIKVPLNTPAWLSSRVSTHNYNMIFCKRSGHHHTFLLNPWFCQSLLCCLWAWNDLFICVCLSVADFLQIPLKLTLFFWSVLTLAIK